MIETLVSDLECMTYELPRSCPQTQVAILREMASTATWVADQLAKELNFEHALEVFNQHGTEADPPFGAMLIKGRVLVCNYRTAVGVWVNGHVKDKSFITREVEVRRDWSKGEKGYE